MPRASGTPSDFKVFWFKSARSRAPGLGSCRRLRCSGGMDGRGPWACAARLCFSRASGPAFEAGGSEFLVKTASRSDPVCLPGYAWRWMKSPSRARLPVHPDTRVKTLRFVELILSGYPEGGRAFFHLSAPTVKRTNPRTLSPEIHRGSIREQRARGLKPRMKKGKGGLRSKLEGGSAFRSTAV